MIDYRKLVREEIPDLIRSERRTPLDSVRSSQGRARSWRGERSSRAYGSRMTSGTFTCGSSLRTSSSSSRSPASRRALSRSMLGRRPRVRAGTRTGRRHLLAGEPGPHRRITALAARRGEALQNSPVPLAYS